MDSHSRRFSFVRDPEWKLPSGQKCRFHNELLGRRGVFFMARETLTQTIDTNFGGKFVAFPVPSPDIQPLDRTKASKELLLNRLVGFQPVRAPIDAGEVWKKDESMAKSLWKQDELQQQFDRALNRHSTNKDMLQRAYNPVTDRTHIEMARQENDEVRERAYVSEMYDNLHSAMAERLQVAENVTRYDIGTDDLVSEHFPDRPFSDVLEKGAAYRLKHNTPEAEREGMQGERGGWEKIRAKFTNPETPIGTTMTSLSPRGIAKDTAYDRQTVDEFELKQDAKGKKYVEATRRLVDFDELDYDLAALTLDPQFSVGYDGRPWDAWMLSHPVEGRLPDLNKHLDGMPAATFEKIFDRLMVQELIAYYIDRTRDEQVDWKQVALSFNAILNKVDAEEQAIINATSIEQTVYYSTGSVHETVQTLGYETPAERGGAGCPTSKGYDINTGGVLPTLTNASFNAGSSVAGFATSPDSSPEMQCVTCPFCGATVDAIVTESNISCPECSASVNKAA